MGSLVKLHGPHAVLLAVAILAGGFSGSGRVVRHSGGCVLGWRGGSPGLPAAKLIAFRQNSDVRSRISICTKASLPLKQHPQLYPSATCGSPIHPVSQMKVYDISFN